jgi:hypothetical protein
MYMYVHDPEPELEPEPEPELEPEPEPELEPYSVKTSESEPSSNFRIFVRFRNPAFKSKEKIFFSK